MTPRIVRIDGVNTPMKVPSFPERVGAVRNRLVILAEEDTQQRLGSAAHRRLYRRRSDLSVIGVIASAGLEVVATVDDVGVRFEIDAGSDRETVVVVEVEGLNRS